jgi:hypothetical protein
MTHQDKLPKSVAADQDLPRLAPATGSRWRNGSGPAVTPLVRREGGLQIKFISNFLLDKKVIPISIGTGAESRMQINLLKFESLHYRKKTPLFVPQALFSAKHFVL